MGHRIPQRFRGDDVELHLHPAHVEIGSHVRLLNLSALFLCILTAPLHANDVRTLAESLESKAVHGDLKSAYKLPAFCGHKAKRSPQTITPPRNGLNVPPKGATPKP